MAKRLKPMLSGNQGKGAVISTFATELNRGISHSDGDLHIEALQREIDGRMRQLLPDASLEPENLHKAMRFGALAPGKRVRPLLAVLVAEASGGHGRDFALDAGCAVECVHTASLILDDLPCMDDAEMRRGQSTTHRQFGEATAILAAIGLLNRAFGIISESTSASAETRTATLAVLSNAVGSNGMIAGQEIDLKRKTDRHGTVPVENLNWLKTGVLFVAAAQIGGIAAGLDANAIKALKEFAKCVGLAFQTADDLVDQSGDTQTLGKDVGKDAGMATLVSVSGEDVARRTCEAYLEDADRALVASGLGKSGLRALVDTIFGAKM